MRRRFPWLAAFLLTLVAAPVPVRPQGILPMPRGKNSFTGFTVGFSVEGKESFWREIPLHYPYDRRTISWWDNVVEEASIAEVDFIAPVTRGCNPCRGGHPGNACPRELDALALALHASKSEKKPKIALFVDTGGAFTAIKNACKHGDMSKGTVFDWGDADGLGEGGWQYFWEHNIDIFYDRFFRDDLFLVNGRPLIYFWSVAEDWYGNHAGTGGRADALTNSLPLRRASWGSRPQDLAAPASKATPAPGAQTRSLRAVPPEGNLTRFLRHIRAKIKDKLGVEPFIVVDQSWPGYDPSVTWAVAEGVHDWFDPSRSGCTVRPWGRLNFAVSVPGFVDPPWADNPRVLPRKGGQTLRDCLTRIRDQDSFLTLLEGLTDVEESAGYYRSDHPEWRGDPNLYLNIVRESLPGRATPRLPFPFPDAQPIRPPVVDLLRWRHEADVLETRR